MEKIKTIIVEDEPLALQSLCTLLERYCPEVEVLAALLETEEAMTQIETLQPDLLLLDIQLKEGTSFELLNALTYLDFEIIFITAFSQYAIKAIKFNALDYLLKPVDVDALKSSVDKVKERLEGPNLNRNLRTFIHNTSQNQQNKIITLPTSDTLEFVKVADIIRCKAEGAYTRFFTMNNGSVLVSKNIKTYEELLDEMLFFRPHQSHLINRSFLKRYVKTDGGYIIMTDQEKIPVSKYKRAAFMEWITSVQD